jgi:hypothetical protein
VFVWLWQGRDALFVGDRGSVYSHSLPVGVDAVRVRFWFGLVLSRSWSVTLGGSLFGRPVRESGRSSLRKRSGFSLSALAVEGLVGELRESSGLEERRLRSIQF